MKLIPLPSETQLRTGFTHKVIIDYLDIVAMGAVTTLTKQIFPEGVTTFPAGTAVLRAALNLITAFDFLDAAIVSLLVEVGDGGDPDRLITSTELAVDGTEILFKVSAAATQPYAYLAADGIDAVFLVAGGASPLLSEATAGKVEIYLELVDLNALEAVT